MDGGDKKMKRKLQSMGAVSKRTWNELAEDDAMFYILTDEQKKDKWNPDEFFEIGKKQWIEFKELLHRHGLENTFNKDNTAVDIGCGMGRMSFAMSDDFGKVIGIDVSEVMIQKAKTIKEKMKIGNCEFIVGNGVDLSDIPNSSIDFCFSYLTLQHCPSSRQVLHYIKEFSRVLKPDGVALFQFRVAPTYSLYLRFILIHKFWQKVKRVFGKVEKDRATDAFIGNWVPYTKAHKIVSINFRNFYLIQTPVEIYRDRFWDLSDGFERWKRSFWLCIK